MLKVIRMNMGIACVALLLVGCVLPLNNDPFSITNQQASQPSDSASDPVSNRCSPMPMASDNVVHVSPSQSAQLSDLVSQAESGTTLSLADGEYNLAGDMLWFAKPGITLRSASGHPESVILNGGYATTEVVTVAASDVTIAEITIKQAYTHGIHVISSSLGSTLNTQIYRVHILDSREQAIKINPHNASGVYADQGSVACSILKLTDSGRPFVNPTSGGCYTGGIDAHQAKDWTVRDNHFEGFWCPSGLSEHAVHFWRGGANTIIERNTFENNARAIGFGLANSGSARTYNDLQCTSVPATTYVDHYAGIIRNNLINNTDPSLYGSSSGVDCSICLWSACDAKVVHNTQYGGQAGFSGIEWRFAGSQSSLIANNLVSDPIRQREEASANEQSNRMLTDTGVFVDASGGDFHLQSNATSLIDQGTPLEAGLSTQDFDQSPRDALPDIGAFEYSPSFQ